VREHFWFTTQPIDSSDEAISMVVDRMGRRRSAVVLMSDYPHWDFDDPRFAFRHH
jgi:hypothetical protein